MTTPIGPRTWRPLAALLLGLLSAAALATPALAADAPDGERAPDPSPISLRVSPAVIDVPHETGTAEHEIRVENRGDEPMEVITDLAEFTVTEDGTTEFLGPDAVSATGWVDLDAGGFGIAPGESREVGLTVDVPDDAEPGERYLSVLFSVPGKPDAEGNISVTHRVAVKLYIEVPGLQVERLDLGELSGPTLVDGGPAIFELPVHNRGNVHQRFQEDGRLVATSGGHEIPFENFTVIGDATRVVEATWPDPPLLCWCTVEVEVDDGQGNLLTASTRVIAFPLRLTLAMLALTMGLSILAAAQRRRRAARLEDQLEQARHEGATTRLAPSRPTAPAFTESSEPDRDDPTIRDREPTVPAPHPAPYPSGPPASEPHDEWIPAASPATPMSTAQPSATQTLDTALFTAHGTPSRTRRRRRR